MTNQMFYPHMSSMSSSYEPFSRESEMAMAASTPQSSMLTYNSDLYSSLPTLNPMSHMSQLDKWHCSAWMQPSTESMWHEHTNHWGNDYWSSQTMMTTTRTTTRQLSYEDPWFTGDTFHTIPPMIKDEMTTPPLTPRSFEYSHSPLHFELKPEFTPMSSSTPFTPDCTMIDGVGGGESTLVTAQHNTSGSDSSLLGARSLAKQEAAKKAAVTQVNPVINDNQTTVVVASSKPPIAVKNKQKGNIRITTERYRTPYTAEQRDALFKAFQVNGYISQDARESLARQLGLTSRQIKIWFQNQRAKQRRALAVQTKAKQQQQQQEVSVVAQLTDHQYSSNNQVKMEFY